ncbi:MAG: right-handed parallel beta-helix repeat-containing protein [Thermoguttaceae bacterium]|nr:right-handed parallel beta-helix repeat-containing protein [Thermoguttaceae bacterium]
MTYKSIFPALLIAVSSLNAYAHEFVGDVQTLEKLRDDARAARQANCAGDVVVTIPQGDYYLPRPLILDGNDSGTEQSRTVFRADGKVRFLSGVVLTGWKAVTDESVLNVLPESARGKVYQADAKAAGVTDFGSPDRGGAELFFDDKPMTLSRYPNKGFIKIADVAVLDKDDRGTKASARGAFFYEDDRVSNWKNEKDPWLSGYWCYDWSESKQRIDKLDPDKKFVELKDPQHSYGYRKGQWFYGFNLLSELDQPGEYYIDREAGIVYFYAPVDNVEQLNAGEAILTGGTTALQLQDAKYVTFESVTIEGCRQVAVSVRNCKNIALKSLLVRNGGDAGFFCNGGGDSVIDNCEVYGMGSAGIAIYAGDRNTLAKSNWTVQNCYTHHFARIQRVYNPGLSLHGVGITARNNLITDAPHNGILFSGNYIVMEYNEITRVCWESNDAGAVYCGRNWTMRGNVFRYNYMHDVQGFENKGCVGIYLDDMFSSCRIEGNIFQRVTRAAMIGGGRDNAIVNNVFIDCLPSLHIDARGIGWAKYWTDDWTKEFKEKGTVLGIAIDKPPYSEQFPELAKMIDDDPGAPKGNEVSRNICYKGVWDKPAGFWNVSIQREALPFLKMENNTVWTLSADKEKEGQYEGDDPLFVNPEHPEQADFQLQPNSPALKAGFVQIPFKKIGRHAND